MKIQLAVLILLLTPPFSEGTPLFKGTISCGEYDASFLLVNEVLVGTIKELESDQQSSYWTRRYKVETEIQEMKLFLDKKIHKATFYCGWKKGMDLTSCHGPLFGDGEAPTFSGFNMMLAQLPDPYSDFALSGISLSTLTVRYVEGPKKNVFYNITREMECAVKKN